ncbi:hypothetical protein ABEG17_18830 [Pedococcus sp. KACC 23699]|uniref:Glycosyltransferase RgtA/B/C/D-like domain-containing protein n=1 Tax=Pedococcus sp. KACC 23699 TaxID=3149228 RepID=A0AAU7JT64_9MICO
MAFLTSLVLALVVCGRSFGRGLFLYRDFVTVPALAHGPGLLGRDGEPPRAVPLDAVMAALSPVVSTGAQQQVMLLASLVLAGCGVAVLLRQHGTAAMVAGAAVATWNPYVAERLALGQPPTLLAYSMTPWLVATVRSGLPTGRALAAVLVCALPAALTPWGSLVAALVVIGTSLTTPRRRHASWRLGVVGMAVLWSLPWVLPALTHGAGAADPDGARAFALRADSSWGLVGSALTLGGSWAAATVPDSRSSALAITASLLLVVLALAGVALLGRRAGRRVALLAAGAWLLPVVAAAFFAGPGLELFAKLQRVPGVAIGRDTHRWLGLTAITSAVLVGVVLGEVARLTARRAAPPSSPSSPSTSTTVNATGRRPSPLRRGTHLLPGAAAAVVVLSAAVLTVPDLPSSVGSAYRPLQMPADWAPTVRAADRAAGQGRILVLPYQSFRRTPWAGGAPFLDPTPRALRAPVLASRQLVVARGRQQWTVDDDAVTAGDLGLTTGSADLDPAVLRQRGVTAVVEWRDSPGSIPSDHAGMTEVFTGPHFRVWVVTRSG